MQCRGERVTLDYVVRGDSLSHSCEPGVLFQLSSQCPKCLQNKNKSSRKLEIALKDSEFRKKEDKIGSEDLINPLFSATHAIPPSCIQSRSKSNQNISIRVKWVRMLWITPPSDSLHLALSKLQAWRDVEPTHFRPESIITIIFTEQLFFFLPKCVIDSYEKENYSYQQQILKRANEKKVKCLVVPKTFCSIEIVI